MGREGGKGAKRGKRGKKGREGKGVCCKSGQNLCNYRNECLVLQLPMRSGHQQDMFMPSKLLVIIHGWNISRKCVILHW